MKNKKGQLNGLTAGILSLVVAIIVLVMGIVIIQEIRDTDVMVKSESSSFTNETLATVTETGENLACNANPVPLCSLNFVTNATDGSAVPASNYTQTNCNLAFSGGAVTSDWNNTNWNVSYSCTFGGEAFVASNSSLVGLGNFSDFIPIIVIALAASIIIGLILVGFAFGRRER